MEADDDLPASLKELQLEHQKKFDEICAHLAERLGHGSNLSVLADDLRKEIADEAEELTENWDSDVETSDDPKQWEKGNNPDPGLQQLLAEHYEIGERILNILDEISDEGDED